MSRATSSATMTGWGCDRCCARGEVSNSAGAASVELDALIRVAHVVKQPKCRGVSSPISGKLAPESPPKMRHREDA